MEKGARTEMGKNGWTKRVRPELVFVAGIAVIVNGRRNARETPSLSFCRIMNQWAV